nr:MAG TPA: hypothetical protein [Caudoviricetes sp.]
MGIAKVVKCDHSRSYVLFYLFYILLFLFTLFFFQFYE